MCTIIAIILQMRKMRIRDVNYVSMFTQLMTERAESWDSGLYVVSVAGPESADSLATDSVPGGQLHCWGPARLFRCFGLAKCWALGLIY